MPAAAQGAPAGAPADAGMEDPALEQKMASAEITPEHPDYIKKLEKVAADRIKAGADYAAWLHNELVKEATAEEAAKQAKVAAEKEVPKFDKTAVESAAKILNMSIEKAEEALKNAASHKLSKEAAATNEALFAILNATV